MCSLLLVVQRLSSLSPMRKTRSHLAMKTFCKNEPNEVGCRLIQSSVIFWPVRLGIRDMTRFQVELNGSGSRLKCYRPGETICGIVHVVLQKEIHFRGIRIAAQGFAQATLSTFVGKERYFDDSHFITDPSTGQQIQSLPAGHHQYTFTYVLPKDLPASAISGLGQIVYRILAEIIPRFCFPGSGIRTEAAFTVKGNLDLNLVPAASQCVFVCKQKKLHYFTLSHPRGPIGFELTLSKSGFVPGESLDFRINLFNHSSRAVVASTLTLIQEWEYEAAEQRRDVRIIIFEINGPRLSPGKSEFWSGEKCIVPQLPPTGLRHCGIMSTSYLLKFKMKVAGRAINLRTSIPIVIGTKRVESDFDSLLRLHGGRNSTIF